MTHDTYVEFVSASDAMSRGDDKDRALLSSLAAGGGALFAMLLNRLLWPWRRNRWAMEELSRALGIAVIAATKMYNTEHQHLAAAAPSATPAPTPAAGTSRRTSQACEQQLLQGDVVISMTDTEHHSTQQCGAANAASAKGQTAAAATAGACGDSAAGAAAAAAITGDPNLVTKSPEQLQQMLGALLMPVQVSIARDTWVTWKKGTLALTPVRVVVGPRHLGKGERGRKSAWDTQ